MNVPTQDAVIAEVRGVTYCRLFVALDVARARAQGELQAFGKRPIGSTHGATQVVEPVVRGNRDVIECVTDPMQPAGAGPLQLRIELIAVHDEQAFATGSSMHPFAMYFDLSRQHLGHDGQIRIMVPRNIDESRAGSTLGEERAYHLRVVAIPEVPSCQVQVIDDVTRQHDAFSIDRRQELHELTRARTSET
jgi:hypothetical protein